MSIVAFAGDRLGVAFGLLNHIIVYQVINFASELCLLAISSLLFAIVA